jgi:uroporphyrin-III C-methyltransferase
MKLNQSNSKVIIAGAGPGDVELITVKSTKYLKAARYILVDRLVNPEIIKQYANPDAEIIYVGKHGGQESISQVSVNKLLVEYGKKEGITLRLKGGDVAIFSQLLSEIEALNAHHIAFEIIPGITAASGASASLGIPLTARSYSQGVRFLTFHDNDQTDNINWMDLAQTTDTLVFYMSSKSLPELVNQLIRSGKSDKALAIIEQATTPEERILISSLFQFEAELDGVAINQPALVVIGDVVNLYNKSSQLNQVTTSFFKEHTYAR